MRWIALTLLLLASNSGQPEIVRCERIEWNTFGDVPRTAVVFWGFDGHVMDWRWVDDVRTSPARSLDGRWHCIWFDHGRLLHVVADFAVASRTRHDVELWERNRLPHERRIRIR